MTERMVDVMDKTGKVLHTYPISLSASNPSLGHRAPGAGCRLRKGGTQRGEDGEAGS